ncbi:MAG TPA: glycosyltransferase family 39 protein, partial [Bacteroidales bacterium]|nr:glycosyltransferase family 39 protein [Bacteroidales bacterium]
FQDFNNYIKDGDIVYKDFYLFITPTFPYLMAAIGEIFGGSFLSFRLFGIIERLILIIVVYRILKRFYPDKIIFPALLTASIIYMSNVQDVFYGYNQTILLCSIIVIFYAIKILENLNVRPIRYSILFGIFSGITFSIKQTTGILLPVSLALTILLINWNNNRKLALKSILTAFISALFVLSILILMLIESSAFTPFIEQVFLGASSKGNIFTILFSFLPEIATKKSLVITIILISIFLFTNLREKSSKANNLSIKILLMLSIILLGILIIYLCFKPIFLGCLTWDITVILFLCVVIGSIFIWNLRNSNDLFKFRTVVFYYGIIFLLLIGILLFITNHQINSADYDLLRKNRQEFIYALFFFQIIFIFSLIYNKKSNIDGFSNEKKILVVLGSIVIMYIHGMSHIIEDHGTILAFSIVICELLFIKTVLNSVKNAFIIIFCMSMIVGIVIQRNNFTYHWWGVNLSPTTYKAQFVFDDPKLYGLKSDYSTTSNMNKIFHIVNNNKKYDDLMYTFPHINYFNVMADLRSPTKAKVHYFDVCCDEMAIKDSYILYNKKPDFIVWQSLTEQEWMLNEYYFRAKKRSGQRNLQDVYNRLIHNGDYLLLGKFVLNLSDTIFLWGIKDGRKWVDENCRELESK